VDGEWKLFQRSYGSSCGNSYFKSVLPPRSYYILHVSRPFHVESPVAQVETEYRLKFKLGGKDYYSNPTRVELAKEDIEKAGSEIKPLGF
jgi:hypothetical protein